MSARHDAIVIGAGLSGLSAAALLARAGLDVVVLEKADGPGGCARSFTRDGFTFDPAVHVTVEARPEAYIGLLLEHLGVADQVVFERFGEIYRVDLPGFSMVAPTGREDFLAAHQDAFPAQARGLAEAQRDFGRHRRFVRAAADPVGSEEFSAHACRPRVAFKPER